MTKKARLGAFETAFPVQYQENANGDTITHADVGISKRSYVALELFKTLLVPFSKDVRTKELIAISFDMAEEFIEYEQQTVYFPEELPGQ